MKGRDTTGRFRSLHDRGALVGLVRQVIEALVAAGVVLEPLLVSQADFDQGRRAVGLEIPSAREICRRLRMGWQQLKDLALVEGRDEDKALAKIDQYQSIGVGLGTTGHGFDLEAALTALRLVAARRVAAPR